VIELGVTTFAETHAVDGVVPSARERLEQVLAEVELADAVGLHVYGVGEHHRGDFAASAPAVVLAAAAARTARIRLTSAVTVLSSADPVRVLQDFATLDLLSAGRAEVMVGRGSFTESFPLFGQDLAEYDALFAEKLGLLVELRERERVTWSGEFRTPLVDQAVYPRPLQKSLPIWVGVGGTPQSVVRAGLLGLPMVLTVVGGSPQRFAPVVGLYRRSSEAAGHPAQPLAVHAHGYVAATREQAVAEFYPAYARAMTELGRERGAPAMTPLAFADMTGPMGSVVLGDPEQVATKIRMLGDWLGIGRFLLHISVGTLPHAQVLRAIEMFGAEVAPLVNGCHD
jgi:probable LLM family oxidoreductase